MMTRTALTAAIAALALALGGCAAEPEPEATEAPAAEIERPFSIDDACALLTAPEIIAAFGQAENGGTIIATESGRDSMARPICEWEFDDATTAALNFVDEPRTSTVDLQLTLQRYISTPSCFDGQPCGTPEQFIEAWSAEWEAWYQERFEIEGQSNPIAPDVAIVPDLLGGASTVGMRGIIFLDAEYYAEIEVFWCGSPECRAGIEGMQVALATTYG